MARLYADENFPHPAVGALRALGHDVLTTLEAGRAGAGIADAEVLSFATSDGRAVVTLNRRDFIALHAASAAHAGIVVCTIDPDAIRQARRIDVALRACGDARGQLLRVTRPHPGEPEQH